MRFKKPESPFSNYVPWNAAPDRSAAKGFRDHVNVGNRESLLDPFSGISAVEHCFQCQGHFPSFIGRGTSFSSSSDSTRLGFSGEHV